MLNFNEFQEHIKNTILDYLPEEAAAIIDPNNMDLARSYMQDDFYILPSSVHEVLLV